MTRVPGRTRGVSRSTRAMSAALSRMALSSRSGMSGFRADIPDLELKAIRDSAALMARVLRETPRVRPGTRVIYSDLNAILLGEVVRRVAGEPLDVFVAREVFAPLGLHQTMFRPPSRLRPRIAPTGVWRGHPVAGTVHDGSAFKLRGVSGNAGLFSTAADIARFAQFVLRGGTSRDGRRLLRDETVRLFTSRAVAFGPTTEARALGWQAVPTGESVSSAGILFGARSYGHTGWTGTSLWIDPDRDLFVVLLTNRAYVPRARRPFTTASVVSAGVRSTCSGAGTGNSGSRWSRFRIRPAWRRSGSHFQPSQPRCISCFPLPTAGCWPARMRCRSSCGGCRGSAGWRGDSVSPAYRSWHGGCTVGSRGDGAAWCAATRWTRFGNRMAERSR